MVTRVHMICGTVRRGERELANLSHDVKAQGNTPLSHDAQLLIMTDLYFGTIPIDALQLVCG